MCSLAGHCDGSPIHDAMASRARRTDSLTHTDVSITPPLHVRAGAMFRGAKEAKGEREIICLHALDSEQAARLSMPVIKGVACTCHAPMPPR